MRSGSVTCSCPTTSANVAGRYLRYSANPTARGYGRAPTLLDTDDGTAGRPARLARGDGAGSTDRQVSRQKGTPAPARAHGPLLPSSPGGVDEMDAAGVRRSV